MINLSNGLTFEEYLEKSKLEYGDIQLITYNSTNLSSGTKEVSAKLNFHC